MKKIVGMLIVFLTVGWARPLLGQQGLIQQWLYTYPYNSSQLVGGAPDQFGGYYLLANDLGPACFATQAVLCKVSPNGGQIWVQQYFPDTDCVSETVNTLIYSGTNLYLSGKIQQGWLCKLDSSGAIIWQDTSGLSFGTLAYSGGTHVSVVSPPGSTIFYYDTTGTFQWSQALPTLYNPNAYAARMRDDGSVNVFCIVQDTAIGEPLGIGLYTLDANSNLIFDTIVNHHNNTDPDIPVAMCENENQELFLLSKDMTSSGAFISKINPGQNNSAFQSYLVPNCMPQNIITDTIHGFVYADVRHSSGFHIVKFDNQLNALDTIKMDTCGVSEVMAVSPNGFLYTAYRPIGQDKNLYLLCYDELGNCIETYSLLDTTLNLYPRFIHFDTLNNVFISGQASDSIANDWGFVIKLNSTVGINEQSPENNSVTVYPNPASEQVTIAVSSSETKTFQLNVRNVTGQLLFTDNISSPAYELNTEQFSSGLYFIELIGQSEHHTQKLIIQHP